VVFANELLDNLPFRLYVFDGGWREAEVRRDGDRLTEALVPLDQPLPPFVPARAPHGARVPVQQRAGEWVADARARLTEESRLVIIDYVTARTAELTVRPWREWLRTFRAHQRGSHYLSDPGEQDITTQVCLDQLVAVVGEPDSFRTQAQFLGRWGIEELVAEGRHLWEAAAARPDLAALAARSRINEAAALLEPAGLGGFAVIEWRALSRTDR
jgi:SAM-dependent MidA family methyltransferase